MKFQKKHFRSIWIKEDDPSVVLAIDQLLLPHKFEILEFRTYKDILKAINDMHLRGAPVIGVAAAYGAYLACLEAQKASDPEKFIADAINKLKKARPTAINLYHGIQHVEEAIKGIKKHSDRVTTALEAANEFAFDEIENCRKIGLNGVKIIKELSKKKNGKTINILTHCNAGWLACVDFGTALAPVYLAHERGINIHVWVDETRPRLQGAKLTAWELEHQGVLYTVIPDNASGYLMQQEMIDLVIVGSDRTLMTGDVVNKIGTYMTALAAKEHNIPFYVALPSTTIDWEISRRSGDIKIETRSENEIKYVEGLDKNQVTKVLVTPKEAKVVNYAFDITPASLVTALITERGVCNSDYFGIISLYPEKAPVPKAEEKHIKYNFTWKQSDKELISTNAAKEINIWRRKLMIYGMIGTYQDGVSFGNISIRNNKNKQFYITGTETGSLKNLWRKHYSKITSYNIDKNSLTCIGPIEASSEALTHAAIYECDPNINVVIHGHHLELWEKLIGKVPTTYPDVEYGTPEMATEILRLFKETNVANEKIIVMAGHTEGIISFGKDIDEATNIIMNLLKNSL